MYFTCEVFRYRSKQGCKHNTRMFAFQLKQRITSLFIEEKINARAFCLRDALNVLSY